MLNPPVVIKRSSDLIMPTQIGFVQDANERVSRFTQAAAIGGEKSKMSVNHLANQLMRQAEALNLASVQ